MVFFFWSYRKRVSQPSDRTGAVVDDELALLSFSEVEYDAKRDEKEQHEAKMKEVRKVEELRKEREAESN
jgi:hypothetical protein